jgi:Na+/proline symporter
MNLTLLYWIAFLLYSLIVVGVGFYIWRRKKGPTAADDTQSFWAANKNLSGWSTGLSISASMMSVSWSCVYAVQLFYWYGIGAVWLLIVPWLLTMLGFFIFAPLFRKLKAFSQPELLEKRFGTRSRQLLAPALMFVFVVWGGAEIWAAGNIMASFLNIPQPLTLFLVALVVALYSFTGGFEAVVSTDKIQFTLVALFIVIMAVVGISAADDGGGLSGILAASTVAPKALTGKPWYLSPGFALIALTFLAYLPGWLVETDIWIRMQAARNNREARKGILLAAVNSLVFVGLLPMLIGLSALVLYPPEQGIIPAQLNDGAEIFTVLLQHHTPAWLSMLLGVGLISAAMSTVDTCGNVVALSFSYDILEPHLKNRLNSARLNTLARWVSVGAIFAAFIYALFTDSLWDIFYLSSGVLTTTVFIPVVAVFRPAATTRQVHFATVLGFAGTLIFYFLESRGVLSSVEPVWFAETGIGYILLGFLCSFAGYWLGKIIE